MKKIWILLFLLLLTGCWDYRELNDYAIVTGMAVDFDKDGQYKVSFLIANGKKTSDTETETSIISGSGDTIYTAISNIGLISPKELYIYHLSVVIISEDVAKEGINDTLDYLLRSPQSYQNFYIIVAKDSTSLDTLSIISPLSDYSSQNIASSVQISEKLQGRITNASFNIFIKNYVDTGISPIINSIIIEGNIEKGATEESQEKSISDAHTKLSTLGLFKGDKLVGWANEEESLGINLLLGKIAEFSIITPCNDSFAVTVGKEYDIGYKVQKNKIIVDVKVNGYLEEVSCDIDLTKDKSIATLEKETEKLIELYINKAIILAKKLETDVFGFGSMIYKKYPDYFKSIKDWNKKFTTLDVDVVVDFYYNDKGALDQSLEGFNQ